MSDVQTQRVLQLLAEEADWFMPAIGQGMRLSEDLGLSASERISLAFRIEQEFSVALDDQHYDAITNHTATVSDVLAAVRCLTSAKETA